MATARLVIKGEDQLKGPLKQAQNELTGFESVAQKVGDTLKKAFTVAAIVKGIQELTKAVAECVSEFKEQVEIDTRLDAVLKATGQQYKYTTQDIKKYSQALQEQTRFGDEVIEQSAQLLIATQKFSKDGLERTLELSADLAEAMGTDLTSATSTLSKALIEPGEGLNRLKTIGISFTDAEEDMIKALREAGDELGAQQVILDKVEKAYGGVAKSVGEIDTSTLDKIKNVWGDLKQDLGKAFADKLSSIFNWVYKTLTWLERLVNQTNQKRDFNTALHSNDVQGLADNFTEDYLKGELAKVEGEYNQAILTLTGEYLPYMNKLWNQEKISITDFIRMSYDEQYAALDKILRPIGDESAWTGILNAVDNTYQYVTILAALEKQQKDLEEHQFKWEQEQNQIAIDTYVKAAAKTEDMVSGAFSFMADATKSVWSTGLNGFAATSFLGTGISDSTYMSTMFGDIGMWAQTTQAFMETFYDWETDFDVFVRKFGEPDRQSGLGLNFGIASGDFGLKQLALDFHDTMSILGPDKVRQYIDFGDQRIQEALKSFGSYSESYQSALLQQNIDAIQNILDNLLEPGTTLYSYFEEIVKELKGKQNPNGSGSSSSSSGGGSGMYEWGKKFGEDMDKLMSDIGNTLFDDFKSQLGQAGDLINRLTTNMAQFGPMLGAIITALHYVIEGFVETIGPILEDFVQWGLEPLREFGRMIGQIITPILEEIMPSVIATGKVLMNLFGAIARLLTPIVEILMRVIGPVLTVLADILVSIVGTISWAIDWIAYCITWVLNKISFGWIQQSANPGRLNDYLSNMYSDPGSSYSSAGMNSTGTTNASYQGGTVIHLTVINNGNVCGDAGILEFATMIKNELSDVAYYGR